MSTPASPLLVALRQATAPGHERLEAVMALDVATLTPARYIAALQVLHAMRCGWEPRLEALFPGSVRAHRIWLAEDLAALGAAPLPPAPPLAMDGPAAWGIRYVLEGSALGGRVLLRRVLPMGFTPERGARYFAGEGAQTGPRWTAFLRHLDAAGPPPVRPAIVEGAVRAFEALTRLASARFDEGLDPRQDLAPPLPPVEDAVMAHARL